MLKFSLRPTIRILGGQGKARSISVLSKTASQKTAQRALFVTATVGVAAALASAAVHKQEPIYCDSSASGPVSIRDTLGQEVVPTGNSTVPTFPKNITIQNEDYLLLGLGPRKVTFLSITIYIVGFYIASADIPKLQEYLVKTVNEKASTLIGSERDVLRNNLLDPVIGEELWDNALKDLGIRSAVRIMTARDTDFFHMRDGLVRAISSRTRPDQPKFNFSDVEFGNSMSSFKGIFPRAKAPYNHEMLLARGSEGQLKVTFQGEKVEEGIREFGSIQDERVSRLLFLNYLGGKNVASEPVRQSIVDGVMLLVERPIGTVTPLAV